MGGTRFLYEVEDWDREGEASEPAESSKATMMPAIAAKTKTPAKAAKTKTPAKAAKTAVAAKAEPEEKPKPASKSAKRRHFEFVEGKSSKFWEVWVEGSNMYTQYGRIGSSGQTTVKSYSDEAAAKKAAEKLIAEKTGKGYEEK
jgi:DNA ligase-1